MSLLNGFSFAAKYASYRARGLGSVGSGGNDARERNAFRSSTDMGSIEITYFLVSESPRPQAQLSTMAELTFNDTGTLRIPRLATFNYEAALTAIGKAAVIREVRRQEHQTAGFCTLYIDIDEFKNDAFKAQVMRLSGKEAFQHNLPRGYIWIGIGKNQAQCDAEAAAVPDAELVD